MQKNGKNMWLKMPMVGMAALLVSFCLGIVADDLLSRNQEIFLKSEGGGNYAAKSN